MSNSGEKLAFSLIDQTCPIVDNLYCDAMTLLDRKEIFSVEQLDVIDKVIGDLIGHIKGKATEPLREQLIYACSEWSDYEDKCEDLENVISNLESDLENRDGEIDDLRKDNNDLSNQVYDLENELKEK